MSAPHKFRRRAPRALRRQPRLKVSAALSRELTRFADMLEIRASDLLRWHISDLMAGFNSATHGLLLEWADGAIEHSNPEQAARVKERATAWLERQAAKVEAKEAKGGQKP